MLFPESELIAQARRAMREERLDDAQGILVNLVVTEPENDEAWIMLAETLQDPERKLECLERALRINPRNPATKRAIQAAQQQFAQAAFGTPLSKNNGPDNSHPELADPILEYGETVAHAVVMTTDPAATRSAGLELVQLLERARRHDALRTRRWATSAGRGALVKYEKALTVMITNLPQNDPQLSSLREQRQRALDFFK
jgi:hypothetical protein